MTIEHTERPWEEWQLSAYLLGELEPETAEQIATAAASDPSLAEQLKELSQTLDEVKALLSRDGTSAKDQTALAELQLSVPCAESSAPGASADVRVPATLTVGRLVTRWESWAAMAAMILVGVLLMQRPAGNVKETAMKTNAVPTKALPLSGSKPASRPSGLDESVIHEAWNLSGPQQPLERKPVAAKPADNSVTHWERESVRSSELASAPAVTELATTLPAGTTAQSWSVQDARLRTEASDAITLGAKGFGNGRAGGMDSGMDGGGYLEMMSRGGSDGRSGQGSGAKPATTSVAASSPRYFRGLATAEMEEVTDSKHDYFMDVKDSEARLRLRQVRPQNEALSNDRYAAYADNEFQKVDEQPLSTFSIDVDTASYTKTRQFLLEQHQKPPASAVRIEEFINYFDYDYAGPKDDKPFASALAVTQCPWQPKHQLVRIALQAKRVETADRPKANLVFLLDVSGSMDEPNKLPLVKESMRLLTYQLTENDKVAMVVYAGAAGCVLESTYGHQQDKILEAIERLNAGGSTNGGQGIQLAYKLARENFIPGGINRVILCTDGDFNVGVTNTDALVEMVKEQAQSNVFLTVLGFGNGNTNDAMMEQIADRGNGLYGFVDSRREAQRQMVKQLAGNLMTVAKDVKIQVEFNPAKVRSYRLIGYENRQLAAEDFNNDKKDAGEIGAGHRVTAIYELVPIDAPTVDGPQVDGLRYQAVKPAEPAAPTKPRNEAVSNELLAVKLRYKQPEGTESQLLTFPLEDKAVAYTEIDKDFRWAAAMAEFGMLLRQSPHKGNASWAALAERARAAIGNPVDLARAEAIEMISAASKLGGQ